SRLFCLEHCFHGAAGSKNAIRIFHTYDFVKLHEIDMICLKSTQGFIDLFGGGLPGASIDLCHQKDALSVSIAQRFAHADFASAVMIVPAVIQEVNAAVDRFANEPNAFFLVTRHANVVPTQANGGDLLASASQLSINHLVLGFSTPGLAGSAHHHSGCER